MAHVLQWVVYVETWRGRGGNTIAKRLVSRVRRPVRREGAQRNLLLTLLSFAASVAATRLFLEITRYPQLGGGELHIAHVLWGGLLLFGASLLPLIFANRWVYPSSAVLAGLGVGLFIDEVGKFITQSNDYFYPAAAPIVYALFLLTVIVYLQVRHPSESDARRELYHAFEALQEVLDHDLEPSEVEELSQRLHAAAQQTDDPESSRLAKELDHFLHSQSLLVSPETLGPLARIKRRLDRFASRWLTPRRLVAAVSGALIGLGLSALVTLARVLVAASHPGQKGDMIGELVTQAHLAISSGLAWFAISLVAEGVVGLVLLAGAGLLLAGRGQLGFNLAYGGLLFSLAGVDLLVFYFEQFSSILVATVQFLTLLGLLIYRRRHLDREPRQRTTPR